MSTGTKIWLIIAIVLIIGGSTIFVAVMSINGWNFRSLNTTKYTTNTHTAVAGFEDISVESTCADITFYSSDDAEAKVVCYEMEKAQHTVTVEGGKLVIKEVDLRHWYDHIGINFDSPKINVYLPKNIYGELKIDCTTGDISLADDFQFDEIDIRATTGDVKLADVTCQNDLRIKVSTGDTSISNVSCNNFDCSGTTGDVAIENLIATDQLDIRRTTGDVTFKASDAKTINIRVGTGSVTGSLLTGKTFTAKATTGSVNIPESTDGGTCNVTTTTGSIQITVG